MYIITTVIYVHSTDATHRLIHHSGYFIVSLRAAPGVCSVPRVDLPLTSDQHRLHTYYIQRTVCVNCTRSKQSTPKEFRDRTSANVIVALYIEARSVEAVSTGPH